MNNSFGKPVGARSRLLITLLSGLAVIVLALGVAACGDDDDDDDTSDGATATSKPATSTPATSSFDYESLSGEISVDGSSTVFPITQAVAEEFSSEAPDVRVNVAFSGTGGGFE
jgi:phosphate transport system substrate-binding protein